MIQYRQGDVLLEKVDTLPPQIHSMKPTVNAQELLIRGESRNHGHFINGKVKTYQNPTPDIQREYVTHYLEVTENSVLEHLKIDSKTWTKEHNQISVPPGLYKVIRQREYNPYRKAINAIKD